MAERYEAAASVAAGIAGSTVLVELLAGSRSLWLHEIWMSWGATANNMSWRISRTTVVGTPTGSIFGQSTDPAAPAALGQLATAWSAAPTASLTFLWRSISATSAARRLAWRARGGGLVVPAGTSVALTAAATSLLADVALIWSE